VQLSSTASDKFDISETISIKIPFHHIDAMEVAWHGHYMKYFEMARCALLEQISYTYQEMKKSGYSWPIVQINIKYVRPAYFGQVVEVTCKLIEYESRLVLRYIVKDKKTGQRLTRGESVQVAVNLDTGKLQMESPDALLDKVVAMA